MIADETLVLWLAKDGRVWHVATNQDRTLCDNAPIGKGGTLEAGLDPRVVSLKGRTVCLKCRRAAK